MEAMRSEYERAAERSRYASLALRGHGRLLVLSSLARKHEAGADEAFGLRLHMGQLAGITRLNPSGSFWRVDFDPSKRGIELSMRMGIFTGVVAESASGAVIRNYAIVDADAKLLMIGTGVSQLAVVSYGKGTYVPIEWGYERDTGVSERNGALILKAAGAGLEHVITFMPPDGDRHVRLMHKVLNRENGAESIVAYGALGHFNAEKSQFEAQDSSRLVA